MPVRHFNISYEFDKTTVNTAIDNTLGENKVGFIAVADGNILTKVHKDPAYREVIDQSMFAICDSSYVPLYLKWIYGKRVGQYCGSQIFEDLLAANRYRMCFVGTSAETLSMLQRSLSPKYSGIDDALFYDLPFCTIDEFDYKNIAGVINQSNPDIIWVALGAPKQEYFMSRLKPHLKRGVMIGVGAVFNFYSGTNIRRAPAWMVRWHLEFLHRLFKEPKKQFKRCSQIVSTLPTLLREEWCRKKRSK